MNRTILSFILILVCFTACKTNKNHDYEIITFDRSEFIPFSSIAEVFSEGSYVIPKDGNDKSFMFSIPESIVYHNNQLYIADATLNKIVIYDVNGNPQASLDKRGNGPQEYLQVTHFDVDSDGNIWILDGRRDVLFKYSSKLAFLECHKLDYQVNYIKCLENDKLLLALSPWDESKYKDKQVLLVDKTMNVLSSMLDADSNVDLNFEFPSHGFVTTDSGIIYHVPVSEKVYHFSLSGELCNSYFIDFKGKSIPEEYRSDIESHYDELDKYHTLVNSVYVDDNLLVGTVLSDGLFKDFIIDRKNNKLYMSDDAFSSMHLVGISGSSAIYYIPAESEDGISFMPNDVKAQNAEGSDVFLIVNLEELSF